MIPAQDVQFLGASEDVQIMGTPGGEPALDYVSIMHGSTPQQIMCAEEVKGEFYGSIGCALGMVGTGLLGVYKIFKGKPAAGVTSLVGAGILYFVGGALATVAADKFTACVGPPEQPKLPAPTP